MSSRLLYKRFESLCQKWPKDETKFGRDYGEFFRNQIGARFPHGELGQVKDIAKVESSLESLERIASNIYFRENPLKQSSSSGLDREMCRLAVSTENLRTFQEQEESKLLSRLKKLLSVKFTNDEKKKKNS